MSRCCADRWIGTLVLVLAALAAGAQGVHFTQFFANPLALNPAHAGFFQGDCRLAANHKSQWPWASDQRIVNFNTSAVSADVSIQGRNARSRNRLGVGLQFINDRAGDGDLRVNHIALSVADQLTLGREGDHVIGVGISGGYSLRAVNFDAFYFNSQWVDRLGFDPSIPTGEPLRTEQTGYFDVGLGLLSRHALGDHVMLQTGYALLHLNRPRETFYDQANRIGLRHTADLRLTHTVNERWAWTLAGYITTQKRALEGLIGGWASISTHDRPGRKTSRVHLGAAWRVGDAVAGLVGYQYHRTRIVFNYDVNISGLTPFSRGNGGFEISLVQTGNWRTGRSGRSFCPEF